MLKMSDIWVAYFIISWSHTNNSKVDLSFILIKIQISSKHFSRVLCFDKIWSVGNIVIKYFNLPNDEISCAMCYSVLYFQYCQYFDFYEKYLMKLLTRMLDDTT